MREDADRLGYNTAEQWMNLIRSHRNDIAKEMNISPENLRWCAAYHNKEENPHVHMMIWSARPKEPYLSEVGIHNIKQTLATDIFRQDNISIYKKQTEVRDDLKAKFKERIRELVSEIKSGEHKFTPELISKMQLLSERLENHKGKKVYGYLDKNTKELVKKIVKMLGNDPQLKESTTHGTDINVKSFVTILIRRPKRFRLKRTKNSNPYAIRLSNAQVKFTLQPSNPTEKLIMITQS